MYLNILVLLASTAVCLDIENYYSAKKQYILSEDNINCLPSSRLLVEKKQDRIEDYLNSSANIPTKVRPEYVVVE